MTVKLKGKNNMVGGNDLNNSGLTLHKPCANLINPALLQSLNKTL
jgi:hypothetical protein